MRPTFSGRRWFWGVGAIFAGALLAAPASRVYAADSGSALDKGAIEVRSPDGDDDDADFQKQVKEVEKGLNELLNVDEDKKVHVKKEFAEGLPMPAQQVERMLQMSVKVGDDGKIRLRNPEQIRPFLPQIQAFLKSGGAGKLKELSKKPPEERKAEMEKMMKEQGLPGLPGQGQGDGGERERPRREREATPPTPPRPPTPPTPPRHEAGGPLEDRVARLEKAIERIERAVKELHRPAGSQDEGRATPAPGARGGEQRPQWQQEPWGWRAEPGQAPRRPTATRDRGTERAPGAERGRNDRGSNGLEGGMREAEEQLRKAFERARGEFEKRMRELNDRFGNNGGDDDQGGEGLHERGRGGDRRRQQDDEDEAPRRRAPQNDRRETRPRGNDRNHNRDRDDDDDDDQDMSLQDLGAGARDVAAGLRKVGEVMTRDDWEMLARTFQRLAQSLKPEDLSDLKDQGKIMQKLQAAVDPADMPRFLEIAGKVLASPEGHAMQKRLDSTIRRFEKLQGDEGGLGGLLGKEGGKGGKAPKMLEGLLKGDHGKKGTTPRHESRDEPKHLTQGAPSNPTRPAAARLY